MTSNYNDSFIDLNRFVQLRRIGEGSSAIVYLIQEKKNPDNYYAAKVSKSEIDRHLKYKTENILIYREVNLMSILDHPSILKFIGFSHIDFEDNPLPTIVMEYSVNGSLSRILSDEDKGQSPDGWNSTQKLITIYGIASGMSYLHSNGIIHRDLKPENILMDDYFLPKIADFGLSKITNIASRKINVESINSIKGTYRYMAPEIIDNRYYSNASDVYAFGMVAYQIVTGLAPFHETNNCIIIELKIINQERPKFPSDVNEAYRELITKCWSHSPSERPTFDQIIDELKSNEGFIDENVDKDNFEDYVNFIDNYNSTFNKDGMAFSFDEFI